MEELKVDACPNPREDIEENNSHNEEVLENITITPNYEDNTKRKTSRKTRPNKKNPKPCNQSPTSAYANVINISNSNGIQIGSTYQISINKYPDKNDEKRDEIIKTDQINRLFDLKAEVKREHLIFISHHICDGWKKIGTYFSYSPGQIKQFHEDYVKSGIKEVIYQLLLDWIQSQPDEAKLSNLANALWECGEKDAVRRLAEKILS